MTKHQMAMDAAGNFVVVWNDFTPDGTSRAIYARRFDVSGAARGPVIRVDDYPTRAMVQPMLAMDAAGSLIVAWNNGTTEKIRARRFDREGLPMGSSFVVNADRPDLVYGVSLAMDGVGNSVIAWEADTSLFLPRTESIMMRRFDASGAPRGDPWKLGNGRAESPQVAMNAGGQMVISWSEVNVSTFNTYDSTGVLVGSTTSDASSRFGAVAMDAAGNFVVTNEAQDFTGYYNAVFWRFNAAGIRLDGPVKAKIADTKFQFRQYGPNTAMNAQGDIVVIWTSGGQDTGDSSGAYGREFAADGTPLGGETRLHTVTAGNQHPLAVAFGPGGDRVLAVWTSSDTTTGEGIFGRWFALKPDDYGNTANTAAPLALSDTGSAPVAGTLDYAGDADLFQFTATVTGYLEIQGSSSEGALYQVLDADSHALIVDSLRNGQSGFFVEADQSYFIRVVGAGGSTGAYHWLLNTQPLGNLPSDADELEPNDTAATANPLPLTPHFTARASLRLGDHDWFRVTAPRSGFLMASLDTKGVGNARLTIASLSVERRRAKTHYRRAGGA
jgi:hypothetical protein